MGQGDEKPTSTLLIGDVSCFGNNVDPDQLTSEKSTDQHLYCLQFHLSIHSTLSVQNRGGAQHTKL